MGWYDGTVRRGGNAGMMGLGRHDGRGDRHEGGTGLGRLDDRDRHDARELSRLCVGWLECKRDVKIVSSLEARWLQNI